MGNQCARTHSDPGPARAPRTHNTWDFSLRVGRTRPAQLPSCPGYTPAHPLHIPTHLCAPTGRKAPTCPLGGATVPTRSHGAFACLIIHASRVHSKYPRIVFYIPLSRHAVDSWSLVARHVIARSGSRKL